MSESRSLKGLFGPRYWGTWVGFLLLRALSFAPFRWQMAVGRALGRLAFKVATSRRRIASRNLRLCFPELDADAHAQLLRAHFENLGLSVAEMAMSWHRPQRLRGRIRLHGAEHLDAVGHGRIIILTAHFGALEVGGVALADTGLVFDAVYREDRNPLANELIRRGRERAGRETIEKSNIRGMVRSLRADVPVWYAPDQSYRRKQSETIPFFGVPAQTNTATSALARLAKAAVVLFVPVRRADGTYDITVSAPLTDFPGEDAVADTVRVMGLIEDAIRKAPEQYFWVHRRFKGVPTGDGDPYDALADEDAA
ncbi:MAG: lipid A biosynthesis lauroyl acyltransferase [Pseudomonadota bacterium]